jgi:hypothetical protein
MIIVDALEQFELAFPGQHIDGLISIAGQVQQVEALHLFQVIDDVVGLAGEQPFTGIRKPGVALRDNIGSMGVAAN